MSGLADYDRDGSFGVLNASVTGDFARDPLSDVRHYSGIMTIRPQHLRALIHLFLRPPRHLAFPITKSVQQRRSLCKLIARRTARDFCFSSCSPREGVRKLKLAIIAIAGTLISSVTFAPVK